jgi:hypothetical protein
MSVAHKARGQTNNIRIKGVRVAISLSTLGQRFPKRACRNTYDPWCRAFVAVLLHIFHCATESSGPMTPNRENAYSGSNDKPVRQESFSTASNLLVLRYA